MKRRINNLLLCLALIPVILAGAVCIIGMTKGAVYIRTNGTAASSLNSLFEGIVAGDAQALVSHTDSYTQILFDASEEKEPVSAICRALENSYSYTPVQDASGGEHSLTAVNTVDFSFLDLEKLADGVSDVFDEYLFDAATAYDDIAYTEDGEYIPEIYEKAYAESVLELLADPEDYYTSKTLRIDSYYKEQQGSWYTAINPELARGLQGGLSDGIMADTLSVPKAVRTFVDDSIEILKGGTASVKNTYTLPYSSTVGPKPDASRYFRFSADQADQVLNIITFARSCGLLGEQDVIFDPAAAFYPDDIICYCDETILIICWKEYIHGCVCNCMEIKVADGSQIKRKLTGDKYNSGILDTMSNMYASTNAVAAMSGDFYSFRPFGTTVYQGQLYRDERSCEVLMIDDQGKFIFYYPDGRSAGELQAFIDENNVQFSLAFGPVIVEDYTPRYYQYGYVYGLGQMTEQFTRAAFGEYDDLHYLFMTSGYAVNATPPADLNAFIEIVLTKNLKNVYNMDGGQTAEIVIQNTPYNQIDYRAERVMSDMVFFATAIPESSNE